MNRAEIEQFLHTQVACWNAGDKAAFVAAYRHAAPGGLFIEYVGREAAEGWPILDAMWERQNSVITIEEAVVIVNGSEAACHNRNLVKGGDSCMETIELYRFDQDGRLTVRYFVHQS